MRDAVAAAVIVFILAFVVLPVLVINRHRLREPLADRPGAWECRLIKRAAIVVYRFIRSIAARISKGSKKEK